MQLITGVASALTLSTLAAALPAPGVHIGWKSSSKSYESETASMPSSGNPFAGEAAASSAAKRRSIMHPSRIGGKLAILGGVGVIGGTIGSHYAHKHDREDGEAQMAYMHNSMKSAGADAGGSAYAGNGVAVAGRAVAGPNGACVGSMCASPMGASSGPASSDPGQTVVTKGPNGSSTTTMTKGGQDTMDSWQQQTSVSK